MKLRAFALAATLAATVFSTPAAHAARGDRSRDRALGDAVATALVKGPPGARRANTKILPIVATAQRGLRALEPGQGSHITEHLVFDAPQHHVSARGVPPLLDHLAPRQRARVEGLAAQGGGTITWSSRLLPIVHFLGERRETHLGRLPKALRAKHTLTVAADGAIDYTYAVN